MRVNLDLNITDLFRLELLLEKLDSSISLDDIDWGVIFTIEKILKEGNTVAELEHKIKMAQAKGDEVRCICGHKVQDHSTMSTTVCCKVDCYCLELKIK